MLHQELNPYGHRAALAQRFLEAFATELQQGTLPSWLRDIRDATGYERVRLFYNAVADTDHGVIPIRIAITVADLRRFDVDTGQEGLLGVLICSSYSHDRIISKSMEFIERAFHMRAPGSA